MNFYFVFVSEICIFLKKTKKKKKEREKKEKNRVIFDTIDIRSVKIIDENIYKMLQGVFFLNN